MVNTTRRSSETYSAYESNRGGVSVLERAQENTAQVEQDDYAQLRAERQANLDKLMNYDRYSAIQEEKAKETVALETPTFADEDIRPTSTTMQFGDDQTRRDMVRDSVAEQHSYHLNKNGKLVVALYALAVTVLLALIVINTGVLAKLSVAAQAKEMQLNETISRYTTLRNEIEQLSDSNRIIDIAENEYGMVRK